MGFDEIKGNQRVLEYLERAFCRGTVPHALLLSGAEGEEAMRLAKQIAQAYVCQDKHPPCGNCAACKKVVSGNHPDISITDRGDSSIKVDEIREIRKNAFVLPNDGEKKVYIICHAENMTTEAQDALLKILEEPPQFTAFILLCYNHNSLLPTVLSRVTHLKLHSQIDAHYSVDSKEFLHAVSIAERIASRQEIAIAEYMMSIEKLSRDELSAALGVLTVILRDALMILVGRSREELLSDAPDAAQTLANSLSIQDVLRLCSEIEQAEGLISKNVGCAHITTMLACRFYRAIT